MKPFYKNNSCSYKKFYPGFKGQICDDIMQYTKKNTSCMFNKALGMSETTNANTKIPGP